MSSARRSIPRRTKRRAFTLVEVLAVVAIISVLAVLMADIAQKIRASGQRAMCANSLRQLGAATALYLADNGQRYFSYSQSRPDGKLWYFGLEPHGGGAEGDRALDVTQGPLYPYVFRSGVEVCPSFPYASALWKPKFKGASWGYGYNIYLSDKLAMMVRSPSTTIVFGDCAQVNNFQAPASAKHPMIEEFYMIEDKFKTIHFRHGGIANFLFADGHIEGLRNYPGTLDKKLPDAQIGRITPAGSMKYLQ